LAEVPVSKATLARVDAVVVPAARPVQWLREAMKLAKELGTGLLVLCSKGLTAAEAASLADNLNVPAVAVDVAHNRHCLPAFTSTRLLENWGFLHSSDTSLKRNLALYIARLASWKRVFFLDDDITNIQPVVAQAAVGLLDGFEVVGLDNIGYPDNSVVCHVHRVLGGEQAQFIGGGGMAVAATRGSSFFPEIYNEDWFYMLGTGVPLRVAVTGQMTQKYHDPFADAGRAHFEELGDCLAEGLFWLLDHGLTIDCADEAHWQEFLGRRGYFIGHLHTEVANGQLDPRCREEVHDLIGLGLAQMDRSYVQSLCGVCLLVANRSRNLAVVCREAAGRPRSRRRTKVRALARRGEIARSMARRPVVVVQ
jgi:hypothetical protein